MSVARPSRRLPAALLAFLVLAAAVPRTSASGEEPPLDLSAVSAVRLTGDASEVRLSAGAAAPFHAAFTARRTGWFARWSSFWAGNECRADRAAARVEGATLIVDVGASGWLDLSDCLVEIEASLPAGTSVLVDQPAASVRLDGDFGDVAVRARAADVSLDGHAASVAVDGEASRAQLAFARVDGTEAVRLSGSAMDARLSFPADTPVSWRVTAAASFVDSRLPDTPGARPEIAIDGDFVRATIR